MKKSAKIQWNGMYELSINIKLLYSTPVTCHLSAQDRIPFVVQCFIINFQDYPDPDFCNPTDVLTALAREEWPT